MKFKFSAYGYQNNVFLLVLIYKTTSFFSNIEIICLFVSMRKLFTFFREKCKNGFFVIFFYKFNVESAQIKIRKCFNF